MGSKSELKHLEDIEDSGMTQRQSTQDKQQGIQLATSGLDSEELSVDRQQLQSFDEMTIFKENSNLRVDIMTTTPRPKDELVNRNAQGSKKSDKNVYKTGP